MDIRLRSLRVVNAGPLDDILIDFKDTDAIPKKVIILGGGNGSGKTTILNLIRDSINLFNFCSHQQPYFATPVSYCQLNLEIDNQQISVYIGSRPKGETTKIHDIFLGYEWDEKSKSLKRKSEGELIRKIHHLTHREGATEIHCPDTKNYVVDKDKLPTIFYFPHYRSLRSNHLIEPPEIEISENPELSNMLSAYINLNTKWNLANEERQVFNENSKFELMWEYSPHKKFRGSIESYFIWLDYSNENELKKIFKELNELDMGGKEFFVERETMSVLVRKPGGREHSINDLSSGEQNLLIIYMEIRRRLDRGGGIIMIDEIENSLHPAFQYRLAETVKKISAEANLQLIFTTHSPELEEYFGTENSRILSSFYK